MIDRNGGLETSLRLFCGRAELGVARQSSACVLSLVNSDRAIADAIKAAQRLLWHSDNLPDATKVVRLRNFVRPPAVQSALQGSSDTFLAFTLRAVELVIADQSRTDREMIRRLRDILNNPHLIQALGPQNSPFGPSWLSVRPAPGYGGIRRYV
jgi:hypothetical protein